MRPITDARGVLLCLNNCFLQSLEIKLQNQCATTGFCNFVVQATEVPTDVHKVIEIVRLFRLEVELLKSLIFSALLYNNFVHQLSEDWLESLELLSFYFRVLNGFQAFKESLPKGNLTASLYVRYLHQLQEDLWDGQCHCLNDLFGVVSAKLNKDFHKLLSKFFIVLCQGLIDLPDQMFHF